MKKLILILSLIATNAFASDGFSAFSLCRLCSPIVFESSKTGILDTVSSSDVGEVVFTFTEEQPDTFYEIRVSTDSIPMGFNTEIRSKSTTGFTLKTTVSSAACDPSVLIYVAIDR